MRTDPRKACANEVERLGWALVHDAIAHPLLAVTLFSKWSIRFHDWTSQKAWPTRVVIMPATAAPTAGYYPGYAPRLYAKSKLLPAIEALRDNLKKDGTPCMLQAAPGEDYKLFILK